MHRELPYALRYLNPLSRRMDASGGRGDEFDMVVGKTMEIVNGKIPVFVGIGGNYTKKI